MVHRLTIITHLIDYLRGLFCSHPLLLALKKREGLVLEFCLGFPPFFVNNFSYRFLYGLFVVFLKEITFDSNLFSFSILIKLYCFFYNSLACLKIELDPKLNFKNKIIKILKTILFSFEILEIFNLIPPIYKLMLNNSTSMAFSIHLLKFVVH